MRDENMRWSHRSGLGRDPVAMHGAPVSFTAEGTGLLPGQNLVLDQSALQNGYRTPFWIDEIRMQAFMSAASIALPLQPAYATSFLFRTGSLAFSAVPVPMILHQPQYGDTNVPLLGQYADTSVRRGSSARWLLPRPLYMEPADLVQASVFRDLTIAAGDGTNPFSVAVTYVGRALPPGEKPPKSRHVPWASSYTHDFDLAYSQTGVQSPFQNPFQRELYVHRFIGRPLSKSNTGTSSGTFSASMIPVSAGTKYAAIDIWDSTGYRLVKGGGTNGNFVPVGYVFDTARCAWTFARPLGPREQYNMAFQTLGTVGGANQLFAVSMLGTREEDL